MRIGAVGYAAPRTLLMLHPRYTFTASNAHQTVVASQQLRQTGRQIRLVDSERSGEQTLDLSSGFSWNVYHEQAGRSRRKAFAASLYLSTTPFMVVWQARQRRHLRRATDKRTRVARLNMTDVLDQNPSTAAAAHGTSGCVGLAVAFGCSGSWNTDETESSRIVKMNGGQSNTCHSLHAFRTTCIYGYI